MLELKHISKEYKTGDLIQKALDDVSVNLRDNEFVAILGPSGSGKTTLLNIIGGLDRYDSGDLVINHISTKKYKDRDWDSYRNHTVGFVFQSYNLILHQTVLRNVELALTISGISKKERQRRALEALEAVGLAKEAHKRPMQMSGGQMQRVAIARALVNNPDILLADEPTGALDSKTSVQVMELLKKVAKDRLVVMVSHNPELAAEYANRIIRIRDGKIVDDTNPYTDIEDKPIVHENMGKAKMSIFTSFSLSFNNLLSKKSRTILTAFAGSIGIIGIALILSLSQGFQNYIDMIQEDTMSSYPLTIQSETTNIFTALLSKDLHGGEEMQDGYVKEIPVIATAADSIGSNDIKSFREYLDSNHELIEKDVKKISYSYSVSPLIYSKDSKNKIVKLNPSQVLSSLYSDSMVSMISSMGAATSMGSFSEFDFNEFTDDYKLVKGTYPKEYDEVLLVLSSEKMMPDIFTYSLGLRDSDELQKMIQQVLNGEEVTVHNEPMTISYDEMMALDFRVINAGDLYRYNSEYSTYEDMEKDEAYMNRLYDEALKLKITGIAVNHDGAGILYSDKLTQYVINEAKNSEIVKKQLANKDTDVFSNTLFEDDKNQSGLDFNDMVSIDEEMLKDAFKINLSSDDFKFNTVSEDEMQNIIANNASTAAKAITSGPNVTDMTTAFTGINMSVLNTYISMYETNNTVYDADNDITYLKLDGYEELASVITKDNYQNALKLMIDGVSTEYQAMLSILTDEDLDNLSKAVKTMFVDYYDNIKAIAVDNEVIYKEINVDDLSEEVKNAIGSLINGNTKIISYINKEDPNTSLMNLTLIAKEMMNTDVNSFVTAAMNSIVNNYTTYVIMASIGTSVGEVMKPFSESMSSLGDKMSGDIMSIDTDKFAKAFKFEMNEDELSRLMSSMMKSTSASYSNNLINLGYQDIDEPTSMSIYFNDFESKNNFIEVLNNYNDSVVEEKKISYTDMTGLLMSSVETILSSVTYVLIAFVSISLIVSSIMIAVITLISVMERTKEIGILRAMGASKGNVSSIFNAETFIIGLLSGALGIAVSYLLLIPINSVIHSINTDITAVLNIEYAVTLIIISVVLTLISGLIPSRKAAKLDPAVALRTE